MKKHARPIRPAAPNDVSSPAYPALAERPGGATRRGFLLAALGTSAAAVTRCMGAPPRPSYPASGGGGAGPAQVAAPRPRWHELTIRLAGPVGMTGCGAALERATFTAFTVSSTNADLVEKLSTDANQAGMRKRADQLLRSVACHRGGLAAQQGRVEHALATETRAWYRILTGTHLDPRALHVQLLRAPDRR